MAGPIWNWYHLDARSVYTVQLCTISLFLSLLIFLIFLFLFCLLVHRERQRKCFVFSPFFPSLLTVSFFFHLITIIKDNLYIVLFSNLHKHTAFLALSETQKTIFKQVINGAFIYIIQIYLVQKNKIVVTHFSKTLIGIYWPQRQKWSCSCFKTIIGMI